MHAYQERMLDLRRDTRFRSIVVFKNSGSRRRRARPPAHPASSRRRPCRPTSRRELRPGAELTSTTATAASSATSSSRRPTRAPRRVRSSQDVVALVPFAARAPFETWLVPRRHLACYGARDRARAARLRGRSRRSAADSERAARRRAGRRSCCTARRLRRGDAASYHWHVEITPAAAVSGFQPERRLRGEPAPAGGRRRFLRDEESHGAHARRPPSRAEVVALRRDRRARRRPRARCRRRSPAQRRTCGRRPGISRRRDRAAVRPVGRVRGARSSSHAGEGGDPRDRRRARAAPSAVDAPRCFDRPALYGDGGHGLSGQRAERFVFLPRRARVAEAASRSARRRHVHDWQAALAPALAADRARTRSCAPRSHTSTIHNLAYQGACREADWHLLNLDRRLLLARGPRVLRLHQLPEGRARRSPTRHDQ